MTDGMFCAKCLSQYQGILSKTQLFEMFETGKYSKLGRTLYNFDPFMIISQNLVEI